MSLESFHNYFGITVKSRKNDEKFGFFDFRLWCRNNVDIIATSRESPVNFTPKNSMINFFSTKKKNSVRHPKMVVFRFWDRTWDPFWGIENFFSSKFNLLVYVFGVKFTGKYHVVGIISQLFRDHGQKSKKRWKIRLFRLLTVMPK